MFRRGVLKSARNGLLGCISNLGVAPQGAQGAGILLTPHHRECFGPHPNCAAAVIITAAHLPPPEH